MFHGKCPRRSGLNWSSHLELELLTKTMPRVEGNIGLLERKGRYKSGRGAKVLLPCLRPLLAACWRGGKRLPQQQQ